MSIAKFTPNDPLYSRQWHLAMTGRLGFSGSTFEGLERIWASANGTGVRVGVWDDGVQRSHWDLAANYDPSGHVIVQGALNNGQPLTASDGHGTSVAGLIAAEANGRGGVGVAYGTSITGIRIFVAKEPIDWPSYLQTLNALNRFDVTNHSYGIPEPSFYDYGDVAKFKVAAEGGRGGLGTVNVKSAGNGGKDGIGLDGNGNAEDASRFTVSVGALDKVGQVTSYSNHGAHILVSAPAGYSAGGQGTVTTDLMGKGVGYNGLLNGDYTNSFDGTSAAGPITAGVVALMLDTNANLGWRDVQNILSYSAIGTGSLYTGNRTNESESWNWKWNGADNWNGGGLHYSEDYGYGLVNAYTAGRFSEVWSMLHDASQTSSNELSVSTGLIAVNREISERSPLSYTFNISQNISLEHVALTVNLQHTYFTDLRIQLVSPEGTVMSLYDGLSGDSSTSDYGLSYTFGVPGLRGEMSAGAWTLQLQDDVLEDAGILNSLSFRGFGSAFSSNDIYHYTDEVLQVLAQNGQSARSTLRDADGGIDWVNASAMWRDAIIDLNAGGVCTLAGQTFAVMDNAGGIENAVCGDGNDRILGSALNNTLMGMRGNDVIIGGKGDDVINGGDGLDTAIFAGNSNEYNLSLSGQTVIVTDKFINRDGSDKVSFVERLKFTDSVIAFDIDGNAGQGYRIYEAAFDRKPDATGLGYWITQIDKGTSLKTVADGFLSSTEFNTLYGSSSTNSTFVDNLYRNILDRAGDKAGIDYWTGVLNNGTSRAEVLLGFSESPENQVGVIGAIQNGIEYKEWLG
jgi:subtilisin-like proprotein convertase family protein